MRHFSAAALLVLASACATGPYSDFAKAGRTYATAVDTVLDKAADERVDLSSEQLLRARSRGPVGGKAIDDAYTADKAYLEQIQRLRDHATALAEYFDALDSLAGSSAPADAFKATGDAFAALKEAGDNAASKFATSIPKVAELVVSGIRSARLRSELREHATLIRQELALHVDLIQKLQTTIKKAEDDITDDERIILKKELLADAPPAYPHGWLIARRELLRRPQTVEELKAAQSAATKMQQAFDALVKGELSPITMRQVAHEVELLVKKGATS